MPTGNHCLLSRPCLAILLLLSFAATCLAAAEPDQPPATPTPVMGELHIEGDAIETLTLARRIGQGDDYDSANPLVLQRPGSSVSIPAGDYLLQEIELTGGFGCYVPFRIVDGRTNKVIREPEWLTISPDKPCTLKAGAPLKLAPGVYRLGRLIHLTHELLDSQGRRYHASAIPRPLPQFAIYQANRQIASSDSMSLEYG